MDWELLPPEWYENADGSESYLQVAAVANSKFYGAKDFEAADSTRRFILLSDSKAQTFWNTVKQHEAKDVALWYDFDPVNLIIL